jgi:RNA polymerase sigma-70 factor (ECF subfamily)
MTASDKSDIFVSVIDAHKGILHKIAGAYSPHKEDLMQEITLQLWKSFDNYDPQYRYSTWIYKVALNVSLAYARKEQNRKKFNTPWKDNIETTDEHDEHEGNFAHLQQFIRELKELDRAILLLYLDEKTQKEMAEIIGLTETNISTRIGRIKGILKQKFAKLPQ